MTKVDWVVVGALWTGALIGHYAEVGIRELAIGMCFVTLAVCAFAIWTGR